MGYIFGVRWVPEEVQLYSLLKANADYEVSYMAAGKEDSHSNKIWLTKGADFIHAIPTLFSKCKIN